MATTISSTTLTFDDGSTQTTVKFPTLAAGTNIKARRDGTINKSAAGYIVAEQMTFVQSGTVRIAFQAECNDNNTRGNAQIRRWRDGSVTTMYTTPTLPNPATDYTTDVSVKPGDTIEWRIQGGSYTSGKTTTTVTGSIRNMRIQTNGPRYIAAPVDTDIRVENN